jgi:signal peptidase I
MNPNASKSRPLWTSLRLFWLVVKFSIAALIIVLPIRFFVAQPFLVSGDSMAPTFHDGDYLVIDKLWYDFHKPQRGDVIIMEYPLNPAIYFVKRIVGLPGETIGVHNGIVTIVGATGTSTLSEPYIILPSFKMEDSTTTLAADEYFVLGDNRTQSSDSREWGPLQTKFIVGRAFMRLFPWNEIHILPGEYRFPNTSSK